MLPCVCSIICDVAIASYCIFFLFLYRSFTGILCLLLLVFFSVILATWSLPFDDDISLGYKKSSPLAQNKTSAEASAKVRYRRSYDNKYDQRLLKVCDSGNTFSRVRSVNHNHYRDRIWKWDCRSALNKCHSSKESCHWLKKVNSFKQPLFFMCGQNMYLKGVDSYHNNNQEDRIWSFYCCRSPRYTTRSCYDTGFVNNWDGAMDYRVPAGKAITGVYSYYKNGRQ